MNTTIAELGSSISEQYYNFINGFVDSDFEDEKALGKFYTNVDVAEKMISEVLSHLHVPSTTSVIKVIDPFCGDGRLIEIFLQQASQVSSLAKCEFELTLWDIDANALQNAAQSIKKTADALNMSVDICAQNGDAYVIFEKKVSGFDVCVTNPPWCLLKPQKLFNSRCSADEIEEYKNAISLYDDYMRSKFAISQPTKKFGRWGTNLARCGVEVAIRLLDSTGICGFVSPASLFNDQVSVTLRKWLFEEHKIYSLSYFPAELKLFGFADVSSVTAVVGGGVTDSSFITRTYSAGFQATERELGASGYNYISRHDYVLPLEIGFDSLEVQASFDAFSSVQEYCISNGLQFTRELDETRVSEKLASKGKIVFVKGYMIDRYSFSPDDMYLNEDIVTPPESTRHSKIVWRDVSRSSQKRRLKGTILGPGHIAGNSLGIIYSEQDKTCELKYLLGIMNSMVFEFQARSRIVSNHVPAGIIKQIRIPAFSKESKLLKAVDTALIHPESEWAIEPIVATLYGLTKEQFKAIAQNFTLTAEEKHLLSNAIEETFSDKDKKMIYNHYAAKLSDLDMQVVHCVPPGGNWKNIPEDIPSNRIAQIRESYREGKGSRSTYYGRLRPEMPAYTINTYFNRPGNGCNIHYEQDRTMSQREAARFQTFPDSFEFMGSLNAVNNQIGNAVPPLLSYQIAKAIPFKGQFVDLFCGAGGLALGFIWAGWTPIIANDIDAYAVETHKRNIGGDAVCGDINAENVYQRIIEAAATARLNHPELPLFVLGGPPCQGFSTANTRRGSEDLRNWLFRAYIHIVKAIQPEAFIFENVRGITNLDKGQFFEMITKELKDCVSDIKVNHVNSANFGIPQRRERVIIVGGNRQFVGDFNLTPISEVNKDGQLGLLPQVIGAKEAIGDLPPIKQSEDGSNLDYCLPPQNVFQEFMRGKCLADEYLSIYKSE